MEIEQRLTSQGHDWVCIINRQECDPTVFWTVCESKAASKRPGRRIVDPMVEAGRGEHV